MEKEICNWCKWCSIFICYSPQQWDERRQYEKCTLIYMRSALRAMFESLGYIK